MTANWLVLVLVLVLLVCVLPTWPYSRDFGYVPSGFFFIVLLILLILFLMGRL